MSFANAFVFPGGVCDKNDREQANSKEHGSFGKITAVRECL